MPKLAVDLASWPPRNGCADMINASLTAHGPRKLDNLNDDGHDDVIVQMPNIEAEYVWINSNGRYLGAPYGGWKQSGIGREECFDELLSYTQAKNIHRRWSVG